MYRYACSPSGEGVGVGVETTESDDVEAVCVDWTAVGVTADTTRTNHSSVYTPNIIPMTW